MLALFHARKGERNYFSIATSSNMQVPVAQVRHLADAATSEKEYGEQGEIALVGDGLRFFGGELREAALDLLRRERAGTAVVGFHAGALHLIDRLPFEGGYQVESLRLKVPAEVVQGILVGFRRFCALGASKLGFDETGNQILDGRTIVAQRLLIDRYPAGDGDLDKLFTHHPKGLSIRVLRFLVGESTLRRLHLPTESISAQQVVASAALSSPLRDLLEGL